MNSKWTRDFNIRAKTIKILEDKTRETVCDLVVAKGFLGFLVPPTCLDSPILTLTLPDYNGH